MNSNNRPLIIGLLLLLLAFAGGYYFWNQANQKNVALESEVENLMNTKMDLLETIDSLGLVYNEMFESKIETTDSMAVAVQTSNKMITERETEIKKLKRKSAEDTAGLQTEISTLKKIKADYEKIIAKLKAEQEEILAQNAGLMEDLEASELRNQDLEFQIAELEQINLGLHDDLKKYKATAFRATNFRLEVRKKGDKPTSSSRRAREIIVAFDLNKIAKEYQGQQTLYLVVKNAQGMPLKTATPIMKRINVDGNIAEIQAQQAREVTLTGEQRVEFKYPIGEKMNAGYYRASIYSDKGLLGAVSFRLK